MTAAPKPACRRPSISSHSRPLRPACRRVRWIRCCRMSPTIFGISIATAAGFSAVFAFTFAIIQPVLGAAADLFGKARLMVVCLVLLGIAEHSRRVGDVLPRCCSRRASLPDRLGRRFSGRAQPDQRSGRCRQAPGRDRTHAGGRHDRQPAGRLGLRPDRRSPRLARRACRARRACSLWPRLLWPLDFAARR